MLEIDCCLSNIQQMKNVTSFIITLGIIFFLGEPVLSENVGTINNPIIDSNMTWAEAVKKDTWPKVPQHISGNQDLIDVIYFSFDKKIHKGQIVIDKRLAGEIRMVFQTALKVRFPIYSAIPISHNTFRWDDNKSMAANNTSAFNYRKVTGGKKLSKHAYGFAIDINPLYNPYIHGKTVLPPGAKYIKNREGTLTPDCPIVKTLLKLGWSWGADWVKLKDYQHFEKVP